MKEGFMSIQKHAALLRANLHLVEAAHQIQILSKQFGLDEQTLLLLTGQIETVRQEMNGWLSNAIETEVGARCEVVKRERN